MGLDYAAGPGWPHNLFYPRMVEKFYELLFDLEQHTCYSQDVKGTSVSRVLPRTDRMYFTLNALDPKRDHQPTETYHRPGRARRADHNVICLRNILIEMDHGSLEEQLRWMNESKIPYSTCVSSGGKSLHFIISLTTPIEDRFTYSRLVKRVYETLSQQMKIDVANKNPSRFSRCPGAKRLETNRTQELLVLNKRVKNAELEVWLKQNAPLPDLTNGEAKVIFWPKNHKVFASTLRFLESGAPQGEWNNQLFRAACNLFTSGESLDGATEKFRRITGTLDETDLRTIQSAHRRTARDLGT